MSDPSRYEFLEQIGENSYSKVWRGHDHQVDRPVTIMVLLESLQANPTEWTAIWDDVLDRVRLKDEHIVSVYDVLKDQGWIVQELMKGNLKDRAKAGELPVDLVHTVLRRALKELAFLHENRKYHGDIKPANLLYDREGSIKVSFSPGLTLGGTIPHKNRDFKYIAPEMLDPQKFGAIGPGVDLYCLGFTIVELLKGPGLDELVKGAQGPDPRTAWMRWHTSPTEQFPPLKELRKDVPRDLEKVVQRLLQKRVQDRYESAAKALADLDTKTPEVAIDVPDEAESIEPAIGIRKQPAAAQAARSKPAKAAKVKPQKVKKVDSSPKDKLSTRESLNKQLSNPVTMTLVAIFIFGSAIAVGLKLRQLQHQQQAPVEAVAAPLVKIQSNPPGATVKVDDLPPAKTPWDAELKPGAHKIKLSLEGYDDHEQEIKIVEGEPVAEFVLKKKIKPKVVAKVDLRDVKPPGTSVSYKADGAEKKATVPGTIELSPGTHELTFSKAGYTDEKRKLTVNEEGKFPPLAAVNLQPLPKVVAKVDFRDVKPAGTSVTYRADGAEKKATVPGTIELSPGTHELTFSKDGYSDEKRKLTVNEEGKFPPLAAVNLEPLPQVVEFQSNPPEAKVEIDGEEKAKPLKLAPGKHTLKLSHEGYTDETKEFVVEIGKATDLGELVLKKVMKLAKVAIPAVDPEDATVTYKLGDEEKTIKTPGEVELSPGTYLFLFSKDGYGIETIELKIDEEGKPEPDPFPNVVLTPVPSKMQIATNPEGAAIWVDNADTQKKTPESVELGPGAHTIKVVLEGYKEESREINVEVGVEPKLDLIELSKLGRLLDGLVAVEEFGVDPKSQLPLKVKSSKVDSLEFVLIRPGSFQFGAMDPKNGEFTATRATIERPYYISTTEVTNEQFQQAGIPLTESEAATEGDEEKSSDAKSKVKGKAIVADNKPVVNVSFDAATNFCKWISEDGRLPTEKEWERAARGLHGFKYPWGGSELTKKRANIRFSDVTNPRLMAVKQLPGGVAPQEKPGLEIYDLLGNAAEWCSDLYEPGSEDAADGPGVGKNHAIRGGSYFLPDDHECRSTWRANVADKGALDVGFRMVVQVNGEAPAEPTSTSTSQPEEAPSEPK